jgi:16S rRNA (cytidine1402-2'-O)-methyltransferase
MTHTKGALYLIPSFLFPGTVQMMSPHLIEITGRITHYFVENLRTARRFLRALDGSKDIDACHFSVVNVTEPADVALLGRWLESGLEVGVISEAGYPCIADPGEVLVREAQRLGARVIPLVGPNAMLMALAASGLNGEAFAFAGYVPREAAARVKALKELEKRARQRGETQILMETPYRNNQLLGDMLRHLDPATELCVAADITAPTEYIRTLRIGDWKGQLPDLHKRPAVFLLGAP